MTIIRIIVSMKRWEDSRRSKKMNPLIGCCAMNIRLRRRKIGMDRAVQADNTTAVCRTALFLP